MKKNLKTVLSFALVTAILATSTLHSLAAGKTINGYKNNDYTTQGVSDAKIVVDGVKNAGYGYTGSYYEKNGVTIEGFQLNTHAIKYWASHGSNEGRVWGDANNLSFTATDNISGWKNGNLEFVFLAACNQLDGLGINPRSKYANAMIGAQGLRVIAGYHESAPKLHDHTVATKFLNYAKAGESVKSAWMQANLEVSGTADNFLVLTHSGNLQYSRFEGFPGATYTRPNSSNNSILRFSKANQSGVAQTLSMPLIAPDYNLEYTPIRIDIAESEPVMVFRDGFSTSIVGSEISDDAVNITAQEAMSIGVEWLDSTIDGISADDLSTSVSKVEPIVKAAVNLEGGEEVEEIVAYVVTFQNTFERVNVANNNIILVIDDEDVKFGKIEWGTFEKNSSRNRTANSLSIDSALKVLSSHGLDIAFEKYEIVFAYSSTENLYKPAWKITAEDGGMYTVDCGTGAIIG